MNRHSAVALSLIMLLGVIPRDVLAWRAHPWASITRQGIIDIADENIDSWWTPAKTIYIPGQDFHDGQSFYAGQWYQGVAYSWNDADDWASFYDKVRQTPGGTRYYGSDCSGFVSVCLRLPQRYTTAMFERDATSAGGYVHSLGSIGGGPWANLQPADMLNQLNYHALLVSRLTSTGIFTMEQTRGPHGAPNAKMRKNWAWHHLQNFRPMRRNLLVDAPTFTLPSVTTTPALNITETSAIITGSISADGGSAIVDRRFEWGTTTTLPNVVNQAQIVVSGQSFQANLSGLAPGTTYYFRALARNDSEGSHPDVSASWGRGEIKLFATSGSMIRLTGNLHFGKVTVGHSAERTLRIHNDGNRPLTVHSISYPQGFSGNWGGTISAAAYRDVTVTFSPETVTTHGGTLRVNSDKHGGTDVMACSGIGFDDSPMTPSDGGLISDRRPQFSWPAQPDATWHRLWINRNGATYLAQWVRAETSWTSTEDFEGGNYRWWIQGWNEETGYGEWSDAADFKRPFTVPRDLVLISPRGQKNVNTLTYRWEKDDNATWYQLWVSRVNGGTWHVQWHRISGVDNPAVTLSEHPSDASFRWWARGWSPDGTGPWSDSLDFVTPGIAPGRPELVGPQGVLTGNPHTFAWRDLLPERTERYRIYVKRGHAVVLDVWLDNDVPATEKAWTAPTVLPAGDYDWWVGAWNQVSGRTIWSDWLEFTVLP